MNQKIFNEAMIAVIIIGFAIVIIQNQMIINQLTPTETPLNRLMKLPEMESYKNYNGTMDLLTTADLEQLAQQYPDVYGNITKPVYRVQLYGEKNLLIIYDDSENKILKMFELMTTEMNQ